MEFWRSTALPHVEARRSCQVNSCYRQHAHDAFSIGLIDEGTSILSGPIEGQPDCYVDLLDLAYLAASWLECNDPENAQCDWPWQ